MQYTDNNGLIIKEKTDNYSRENFNKCMNIIDDGLCKFYVATLDSANTYKVTTGLNKTVLNDGYSIKVAIPSDSTGSVSIIIDSITVPLKQANGNNVTNLKANGVYSLTYYNSVFILASGGGADTVNFTSDKLLTGYSANDSNGEKVNGTMPNKGAVTANLNCGGSYTIPKGYHNGSGKVTANSLATQMVNGGVTLTDASQLISGIKAYSNTGQLLTGNAIKGYKNTIVHTKGVDTKFDVGFTPNIVYMLRSSKNIEILFSKKTGVFNQYSSSYVSPAGAISISGSIVTISSIYESETFTVLAI